MVSYCPWRGLQTIHVVSTLLEALHATRRLRNERLGPSMWQSTPDYSIVLRYWITSARSLSSRIPANGIAFPGMTF